MSNRICAIEGCANPARARGWCMSHYGRWRRYGDPEAPARRRNLKGAICAVAGCDRAAKSREWCDRHYQRWLKHGDAETVLKAPAYKVEVTKFGLRICKVCGVAKPASEYHKDRRNSDGLRAQCKPCRNGYMKSYYSDNRDDRIAYERRRRVENPEHVRAWDRARYERHRDVRIALASDHARVRRARIAGAEIDVGITINALRDRDGDYCCYCNVIMCFKSRRRGSGIIPNRATLEHVMPISRGGSHRWDNVALACHRCNTSKNNKTVSEWLAWKAGGLDVREEASASRSAS